MTSISHWKRPSTTRRNIKIENFDLFESCARLRRIRNLLGDGTQLRLDGILCILGVDSNHSYAMRELANYLLFDFFDNREAEYEAEGYEDFVIEDLIVLVMKETVHVYVNPVNYRYFEPYIAAWRGLRVWCLSDKEYEQDEEISEDFKIRSFVSMTTRCRRIGIAYNHSGYSATFDKMELEKYPIIQAFASEQYSGRGFFTLNYDVFDISERLHLLYSIIDPVIFSNRLLKEVKQFENQWSDFFHHMEEATQSITSLDEKKVMEPFTFYFNHGKLALTNFAKNSRSEFPFVLFGSHSKKSNFEKCRTGAKIETVTLATAGRTGKTAKHMIMHVIAPNSPLRCSRTYFFGYDHEVLDPNSGEIKRTVSYSIDMQILNTVYLILVELVKESIAVYVKTLSVEQSRLFVMQNLPDRLRKSDANMPGTFVSYVSTKGNLDFALKGFDIHGLSLDLIEKRPITCVKNARIVLYDVPSVEYHEKFLGSLVYSENFLDSHFKVVESPDSKPKMVSKYILLTKRIPIYYNWAVYKQDREVSQNIISFCLQENAEMEKVSESFGSLKVDKAPAKLSAVGSENFSYSVDTFLFEKGIIFSTEFNGSTAVPMSEISKIQFYDSESISHKSLLCFQVKNQFRYYIPKPLVCTNSENIELVLTFQPRSTSFNGLYKYLVKTWENTDPGKTKFEILDKITADLESFIQHEAVKVKDETNLFSTFSFSEKYLGQFTTDFKKFMANLKLNSSGSVVAKHHVGVVTDQNEDRGSFLESCMVWITVIGGLPWSCKGKLADNIVQMTKDSYKWVVVKAFDESSDFQVSSMQTSLTSIVNQWIHESQGSDVQTLRLMLVPPSNVELIEIVQGISSHPDKSVSKHLTIQSVIYCVDQSKSFIKFNMTMPKLLDQCSQGLVNCIALTAKPETSVVSVNRNNSDKLQSLLRNVNNDVTFLLVPQGSILRTNDLEIILQPHAFDDEKLIKARYLQYPNWYQGKFKTSPSEPFMFEISLVLRAPLEKHRMMETLKSLSGLDNLYYMYGSFKVSTGVFGRGTLSWFDVKFWVPGGTPELEPTEAATQEPSNKGQGDASEISCGKLFFYGHLLKEKVLKDLLRKGVSPKPAKKVLKTKETLTEGEKKSVHKKRHLEKPPPGIFFNGTYFVSMDGEKSYWHPLMDEFIEDFIKTANEDIKKYNEKLDREKYVDLFDE